jgi:hypothetical protein
MRVGRARNQRSCITARCVALAKLTRENASNFARRPFGGAGSATQLTPWAGLRKGPIPKLPALAPLPRDFGSICGGPAQAKCWTCQRNARLPCVGSPPCLWCYIATLKTRKSSYPYLNKRLMFVLRWPCGRERPGSRAGGPPCSCLYVDTWLILPVVICLSQRLSHACLSITEFIQENCEWLIKSVIVYLIVLTTWITVVILELIHAKKPDFLEGLYLLDTEPIRFGGIVVIHNN